MRNFKTYWDLIRGYLPRYPGPSIVITQQHVVGGTVTAAVILASLIIANPGARIGELVEQVSSLEILVDSLQVELNVTPGYERFELYGFSVEYPEGYRVYADISRGSVNYLGPNITFSGRDTYTVFWGFRYAKGDKLQPSADLADQHIFMNSHLDMLASWFSERKNDLILGDRESCTLKEYPMLYQNYTFTYLDHDSCIRVYGIVGVYVCMESNYRLTVIYHTEQTDVYTNFFNFLDSIKYKGPPRAIPML